MLDHGIRQRCLASRTTLIVGASPGPICVPLPRGRLRSGRLGPSLVHEASSDIIAYELTEQCHERGDEARARGQHLVRGERAEGGERVRCKDDSALARPYRYPKLIERRVSDARALDRSLEQGMTPLCTEPASQGTLHLLEHPFAGRRYGTGR